MLTLNYLDTLIGDFIHDILTPKKSNMKNLSFDHIHYRSSNFDETREFYVGIMEGVELPNEELGGSEHLHIELGGVTLLFAGPKDNGTPVSSDSLGAYHIAYLVQNCKKATEYYRKRGACIEIPQNRYSDTIVATFLAAPDGMMIELKEIKPKPKKSKKK